MGSTTFSISKGTKVDLLHLEVITQPYVLGELDDVGILSSLPASTPTSMAQGDVHARS
jgi:hypothetical protein